MHRTSAGHPTPMPFRCLDTGCVFRCSLRRLLLVRSVGWLPFSPRFAFVLLYVTGRAPRLGWSVCWRLFRGRLPESQRGVPLSIHNAHYVVALGSTVASQVFF